jgi:allantoate deiminase
MTLGEFAQTRLSEISSCSEPGAGVTRLPFTPEHVNGGAILGHGSGGVVLSRAA